jgi:radical SAM/Cys-rich protein
LTLIKLISLEGREHPLTRTDEQNRLLRQAQTPKRFAQSLRDEGWLPLPATKIDVMQINLGKVCNMTCAHCHVDAGPDRKEVMSDKVLDRILHIFENSSMKTLDVTGGAPEMHPRFKEIMQRGAAMAGRQVIHRCNLTAIMTRRFWDIPEMLADLGVDIFASLPYYTEGSTDSQRGDGTFTKSIEAIRRLNALGYGVEGSGLILNLVHNPVGTDLPAEQTALETEYKQHFKERHGIFFNQLFAVTNQPISRFLEYLIDEDKLDHYMTLLVNAFNTNTIEGLMCRDMISISWEGELYDCDFNQMLDLKVSGKAPQNIFDWDLEKLESRSIVLGEHCYACTAGGGSSCSGQLD